MYIPFEEVKEDARIWIYQSNRILDAGEVISLESAGRQFVHEWTAHQQALQASFKVMHALFLIIAVDEKTTGASGCSIDKSVRFLKQQEQKYQLELFNRFHVGYMDNGTVAVKPIQKFIAFYTGHPKRTDLKIFNNLIQTKGELNRSWMVNAEDSWLASRIRLSTDLQEQATGKKEADRPI